MTAGPQAEGRDTMKTVREELAEALRLTIPAMVDAWNDAIRDGVDLQGAWDIALCGGHDRADSALARHEREPEDQDAAVAQARREAFEEAAMIVDYWPGNTFTARIAAAIRARAQETTP